MERLLKKFKAINYIDALTCKYIGASIDRSIEKKNTSGIDKYIEMLKFSSDFIKELDNELVEVERDNNRLMRIVASQEIELQYLKEKVKRLEKHYEAKGL
jgi:archaellum component FlaC